ncbi:MAG TPA: mitofilin family membrane protein [Alphaproteobacteria bacterium]|nr:mitofilin family membrane protein [Alphaproteobacteria bacterium]
MADKGSQVSAGEKRRARRAAEAKPEETRPEPPPAAGQPAAPPPGSTGAEEPATPARPGWAGRAWIGIGILFVVIGAVAYGVWPYIADEFRTGEAPEAPTILSPEVTEAPAVETPSGEAPPAVEPPSPVAVPVAQAPGAPPPAAGEPLAPAGEPGPSAAMGAENAALKGALVDISERLDALARRLDQAPAAVAPAPLGESVALGRRLAQLERSLAALAASDRVLALDERLSALEAAYERDRVRSALGLKLFLAVQQLRAAAREGSRFDAELALLETLAGDDKEVMLLVEPLEANAGSGIPTLSLLQARFAGVANQAVSAALAPEGAGWVDQTLRKLSEVVAVRRTGAELEGDSVEARVARAEATLAAGDLAGAVGELGALSGPAAAAVAPWLKDARARLAAEAQLEALDRLVIARLSRTLEPWAAP